MPMQKVCDEINLHFGLCKSDTKIVLKEMSWQVHLQEELKVAIDQVKEEHVAKPFMHNTKKYRNHIKEWKTTCLKLEIHSLSLWNRYGNK